VINGKGEMKKLNLSPQLLSPDEAEIVADLVVAAFNDAKSKLETKISEEMGGFLPAGMKMPFMG
ncbi:MAG: YbaB/EbfC family nucleoid-associated protein, partial [Holosporaceae bacterium]|nr:YbaB/EbfC family nucleoid-associated protein [Holosporaceae bacterium]